MWLLSRASLILRNEQRVAFSDAFKQMGQHWAGAARGVLFVDLVAARGMQSLRLGQGDLIVFRYMRSSRRR